jgi:hypothetical protein
MYWQHDDTLSHSNSDTACVQRHMGGRLALVKTASDQAAVVQLIQQANIPASWVGATRVSGTFINLDGSSVVSPFLWCTGEPNNAGGNEACAQACLSCPIPAGVAGFNDADCAGGCRFMCRQPNACSGTTSIFSACSTSGTKFWVHVDQYITSTSSALAFCTANYGSAATLGALNTAADTEAALSLVQLVQGAQARLGLERSGSNFLLPSGSTATNVPWCAGEPNNAGFMEACTVLSSNCGNGTAGANDVQCGSGYGVMCSLVGACSPPPSPSPPSPPPPSPKPPYPPPPR